MAVKPGPIPKRSDQRRRRNVDNAVDRVLLDEPVEIPDLGFGPVHPLVADFYESLKRSGQSQYYEPSDWQRARVLMWTLNEYLGWGKPSAMLYSAIQHELGALMTSEADRRRLRLEIERGQVDTSEQDAHVAQMAAYRRAAAGD